VQLIDGRRFFVKMRKSLGNKRNELSPEQIADLTRIEGNFEDGETREFVEEDPVSHQPRTRERVVSRIFDNADFGFRKVTVERPLRLNFAATPERIARIEGESGFASLATSKKRPGPAHDDEVAAGLERQQEVRALLAALAETTAGEVFRDREAFRQALKDAERAAGLRLAAPERKAVETALGERDPEAAPCLDARGNPEPDSDLRDTETVPLKEDVEAYCAREVLPHVPDAWIDESKTKTGYEIPLNRHFYVYEPPRPLEEIEADLQALEREIVDLLAQVTGR
jgi:type I restriction enzyme M protein